VLDPAPDSSVQVAGPATPHWSAFTHRSCYR
jgi:hypothetical protein